MSSLKRVRAIFCQEDIAGSVLASIAHEYQLLLVDGSRSAILVVFAKLSITSKIENRIELFILNFDVFS